MRYELRQYSFGETIGKGFNLYFNNFAALVVASLLCEIPLFILDQVTGMSAMAENSATLSMVMRDNVVRYWASLGIFLLGSVLVGSLLSAYVIRLLAVKITGGEAGVTENNVASITAKIIPLTLLSFLICFYSGLWALLLIIPGIIAMLRYSMSTTVLMLENTGAAAALKRSKNLTKKRKWRIFGWFLITAVIVGCVNQPILLLTKTLIHDFTVRNAIQYALSGLTTPIYDCMLIVIYYNLRIEKEGFNIEHLTRQFALAEGREGTLDA